FVYFKLGQHSKEMCNFASLFRSGALSVSLIICTCVIGSMWQLFHISTVYFHYDTSVTVISEIPENMTVPTVTICIRNLYWLSREKLLDKFPDTMRSAIARNYLRNGYQAIIRDRLVQGILNMLINSNMTIAELNLLGKLRH